VEQFITILLHYNSLSFITFYKPILRPNPNTKSSFTSDALRCVAVAPNGTATKSAVPPQRNGTHAM